MFVLVGLLFSVNSVYAQATPANQVIAIVEILKTLGVDSSKISEIKKILEKPDYVAPTRQKYNSETGKAIPPTKPTQPQDGCSGGHTYNIQSGKLCPGKKPYVPPKPQNNGGGGGHGLPAASA